MNHIYRTIWNHSLGAWQVTSEIARARGKASSKAVAVAGLMLGGVLMPMTGAVAQSSGLLVGTGGSGDTGGINYGGAGAIGGGGGGGDFQYGGGGGGGMGGGGGGGINPSTLTPNPYGGNGGGVAGGIGDTTGHGGGGDTNGILGGTGNGQNASAAISVTSYGSTLAIGSSASYDYVGIGGGGGGGAEESVSNAADGANGTLTVNGRGVQFTVNSDLLVGGGGGGAGALNNIAGAENGGSGGSGTLTVSGGATITVGGSMQVGAGGGGGGSMPYYGENGGNGGTGTVLVNGATLTVEGTLGIGGDGGGSGGGTNLGGNGGNGGNGTLTVAGQSVVNVHQLILGGDSGGAGTYGSAGGSGATGVFNLGGGSMLNFTGSATAFTINSGSTFNLGDATVNDTTGGAMTGLNSLVNNGTVNFNQTDTSTISANISGSGGVNQRGSGTTVLTGANTYTGGTTITGGLINFNDASNFGMGGITLNGGGVQWATGNTVDISSRLNALGANGGTFDTNGNAVTLASVISGAGGLTKTGSGTLTLTASNTYTGGTTITGGLINFSNLGNLGGASNRIALNGGGLQWASGNALDVSGQLSALGANGGTFDTNGNNVTLASVISGSGGMTVANSGNGGALTLTANNVFTGATVINTGATLALSGAGGVSASSGVTDNGTFDISNTTNGASIANLSGGGSVYLGSRTLTINNASGTFSGAFTGSGKLKTAGSGSLILDGNSASFTGTTEIASGLLEVGDINTPQATLGGAVQVDAAGTLRGHGMVEGDVNNNGTVMPGGSIGTLTVGGNYTQASTATLSIEVSPTDASQLKVNGSATLNGVLAITYDPGTYTVKSYTLVSATGGVSGTFSSTTSTGAANLGTLTPSVTYGADSVVLALANAAEGTGGSGGSGPVVVAPIDTSIYTALGTTALLGAQAQSSALLGRLSGMSAASTSATGWITATGNLTNVGGTNGAPGFQSQRYGFLAGLERKLGDYTVGVAAGYDHADIDEQNTGDSGTTDTLRVALYGERSVGPVNLAATFGAGLDFLSQKRPFGPVNAEGDHMGQEFDTGGQASLPMQLGSVTVTPSLGLRYAYFHANSFGESGAGGEDLNVGTDNVHSLQPYVGVTLDKAFGDSLKPVTAELRFGYAHELLDTRRAMSVASQDGTLFAAPGTTLPRGYLTAGAGVTMHPAKHLDVSLSYDTVFNTTHASVQQGSVWVGYRF
ncbi:hypothetical protein LMG27952_06144 [Paraburkholderia hiiakae]|uniref:Autotransporter domain-containing protein n=2 Tax=Paraburkholderia hiiakae TaxID=1081782 RepID=A0ABM8P541_9BURK|nr:hypothetical protein LMG27952_06144 [Paraburkholderia hiiakae]